MPIPSPMNQAIPKILNMFRSVISLLVFSIFVISCNPGVKGKNGVTYKSAVQYNDYIVNRQTILIHDVREFSKAGDGNLDSAEAKLEKLIKTAAVITGEVEGMPAYRGDTTLRDAAVRYFSFFKRVFEQDYTAYLQLRKKGNSLANTDAEELRKTANEISAIISKVTKEEEGYDKDFHNAQQRYAEKNNMKLTENKIQREMEKGGN